ncbi:hypothetical protein FP568_19165 [Pandoraea pnomenusa]|uniref:hypothetical protein n=1 Tax=Pandoraea pnomenusa TaxID=93220 RepID=UPI00119858CB|nr:hypothetical protein [Pandoraea pnomenusa]QDX23138.1 hypothetical protein FP568_19165 [Pandoraea pnomenusa]
MDFLLGSSDCGSLLGVWVKTGVKTGVKKTARLAGGFSGFVRCLLLQLSLSIRQRCEIRKKVKVKLAGVHDGCLGQALQAVAMHRNHFIR